MLVAVKYQIGQYSGIEYVNATPDDLNEDIIAKVKRKLRNYTSLSMYYEHFEIMR